VLTLMRQAMKIAILVSIGPFRGSGISHGSSMGFLYGEFHCKHVFYFFWIKTCQIQPIFPGSFQICYFLQKIPLVEINKLWNQPIQHPWTPSSRNEYTIISALSVQCNLRKFNDNLKKTHRLLPHEFWLSSRIASSEKYSVK